MKGETKYYNFPIQLLQGAFTDISKTMNNIIDYAAYAHTLRLDHGTIEKKMKDAGNYLGIIFHNSVSAYKNGESLYCKYPKNSPRTGIRQDTCFDYFENHKTPNEIAFLLAFLALKSIIGNKAYIKTSNEYLITRMGGYVSKSDAPEPLPEPLLKFNTRRKIDRIKFELETSWELNFISAKNIRGFYVSNGKTTIDTLALEAQRNNKKYLQNQLKMKKQEAMKKAGEQLKLF